MLIYYNGNKQEVYGIIYKIENLINNRVYIGQTKKGFNLRYNNNWTKNTHNIELKKDVEIYGENNFIVNRLLDKAFSKEELNYKELQWIKHYNSNIEKYGYNLKNGNDDKLDNIQLLILNNSIKKHRIKRNNITTEEIDSLFEVKKIEENKIKTIPKKKTINKQIILNDTLNKIKEAENNAKYLNKIEKRNNRLMLEEKRKIENELKRTSKNLNNNKKNITKKKIKPSIKEEIEIIEPQKNIKLTTKKKELIYSILEILNNNNIIYNENNINFIDRWKSYTINDMNIFKPIDLNNTLNYLKLQIK